MGRDRLTTPVFLCFPCGSAGKESGCNAGDLGLIPGSGRSPGEGKGYPVQYSGLESSIGYIVHGVTKSQTWLSDFHFPLISFKLGLQIFTKSYKHLKNLLCLPLYPKTPGSFHSSNTGLPVIFGKLSIQFFYTVHWILKARILDWVAFPFSRGSSQPMNRTGVSCIAGGFFTNWAIKIPLKFETSEWGGQVKWYKFWQNL